MSGSTQAHHAMRRLRGAGRPIRLAALLALALSIGCGGDVESRLGEVRALQDVGQFAASIEELREILIVDPNLAEANYRLGLALMQTGEPSRAVWPLQKAAESSEYEITAGVLLASTHFQTKNYDESVRAADRVLEADPDRQAAIRIRASANLAARRLDAALEDSTRLVELYPDDYGVRVLHASVLADLGRLDEAEREHDLLKQMGAESDDPDMRARSCLAPALFAKDTLKDNDRARALYEDCASRNPTDLTVLSHMMTFFDGVGEQDRATELMRNAVDTDPENFALRRSLATRLLKQGQTEAAEAVLLDAVDKFASAQAWHALAIFYRTAGRPERALEAIDKVVELSGGGTDPIRFTQADVLIDVGEIERAREVASGLQQSSYVQLIRGRILLTEGDPEGALAAFEAGIKAWPGNANARYLAAIAARDSGDIDRAISELREAVRADSALVRASLELARLYYRRGEYREAVSFASKAMMQNPDGAAQLEGLVLASRSAIALGQPDRARIFIATLRERGATDLAVSEQAVLERSIAGPAKAIAVVEASDLDVAEPANRHVLEQLVDDLSAVGRADDAIGRVDAAIASDPENAGLFEMRGAALLHAERYDEARATFERALELDDRSAIATAGLATLAARSGDGAGAVELFDRAYRFDATEGSYAYAAAQLVLEGGDEGGAEARLREIVKRNPEVVGARNDLAWMLAERGTDLDLALALAQEARARDDSPAILDTLGWVQYQRGEFDAAVETLGAAVDASPNSPSRRYRLALALQKAGDPERASAMLQAALAAGSFPEAEEARRELARLAGN